MLKNLSVNLSKGIKCNKAAVHEIIKHLRKDLNFKIEYLPVNFVTSEQIQQVNVEYLEHDYTTDIITFNYSGNNEIFDGEIFISVADADENAEKYKISLHEEILRLLIHGILHLLGHDDKTDEERLEQKKLEDLYVSRYSELSKNLLIKYD